jgi:hypothetical protein
VLAPEARDSLRGMDMKGAERLRDAWAAKGSPPCDHPKLAKERYRGMQTMDKVCTTCGEEFSPPDLKEMGR